MKNECKNCGKLIVRYGPEIYHYESGMIACDLPLRDNDITPRRASI